MRCMKRAGFVVIVMFLIFFSVVCGNSFDVQGDEDFLDTIAGEMVFVKGGKFMMGCTKKQVDDCKEYNEIPAHEVTLSDFFIGKYEVTQTLWEAVMGSNPSYHKGGNLPVEQVRWSDVQEFIEVLNARTGKVWRLPTEAEWEYAARGGNKSQGYLYSGSNDVMQVAWIYTGSANLELELGCTNPVGTKKGNELGIYDMSGNVYEWVHDWFDLFDNSPQTNPQGADTSWGRVLRGGSCGHNSIAARVSCRTDMAPVFAHSHIGFRLALSSR